MNTLPVSILSVTQSDLRHKDALEFMISHVRSGGFWNHESLKKYSQKHNVKISPLIQITKFEDGRLFIHDGHHRLVSIVLGARNYLREDEFVINNWRYEQYMGINPVNTWVTAFDPRTHLRLADFYDFKKLALSKNDLTLEWVLRNSHLYSTERKNVWSVEDLIEHIGVDFEQKRITCSV